MKKKIKWALGILCFIIIVGIAVRILLKYREERMFGGIWMSGFQGKVIELDTKKKEMVVEITSPGVATPDDTISLKKGDRFFVEHYYSGTDAYEGPLRPEIGMNVSASFWDDEQSRQENGELEERNGLPCLRDVAMSEIEQSGDGDRGDDREE